MLLLYDDMLVLNKRGILGGANLARVFHLLDQRVFFQIKTEALGVGRELRLASA